MAMTKTTRIAVPADAVRTREQILDGLTITTGAVTGTQHVWLSCWNCGGSGTYPSSMTPPGMCRLYCWQDRTRDTFGKLPYDVDGFVKKQQAADRKAYRDKVQWELDAPKREAEAERLRAIEVERAARKAERDAAIAAEKAKSEYVGTVGARIEAEIEVVAVITISGSGSSYGWQANDRYLIKMRDTHGNALAYFTGSPPFRNGDCGTQARINATVKAHEVYRDEKQTVVQRVKVLSKQER
jgi:hypothetical protein